MKKSKGYLSNIISALVTDDWSSVISQCTTDSWKEALVATLTHCREHVPLLCERLGERLQIESGNNLSVIQSAILCYICAGNVERLAETWLATHTQANENNLYGGTAVSTTTTTKELQDLIEVVILFQKALELQGRTTDVTGKLAEILTQYAGLLAAQGALNSALTYLGPSENADIVELRERLYYALGHKQAYVSNARTQSQSHGIYAKSQTPNKFPQPRTSLTNNSGFGTQPQPTFNNNIPSVAPVASTPQLWNNVTTPAHPLSQPWNSNLYTSVASNPLLPPVQSKPPSVSDATPHPPRPSSVSSQGSVPAARSKYILDPSVQSSSAYGQTSNMFTPQQSNASFNSQSYGSGGHQSNAPNYNQFNPQQFSNSTNSFNQSNALNSVQQPYNATPIGTSSINSFATGVPPIELAQQAIQQQHQRNPTPPPGWNDPPAIKSARAVSVF